MDPGREFHTFTDAEDSLGLLRLQEARRPRVGRHVDFATSKDQDGKLLDTSSPNVIRRTCRRPTRRISRATRSTISSPTRPRARSKCRTFANSVEIWQEIRDAYSSSGDLRQDLSFDDSIAKAASKADDLGRPGKPFSRIVTGSRWASVVRRVVGRDPLGMVFAAPYAVFLVVVFAYPLGLAVWMSFADYFFAAARRAGRPAVRGFRQLQGGAQRPRRTTFVPQRRRGSW